MSMQSGQPKGISERDALALPEVLLSISHFLSRQTLAQCLLVCHRWNLVLKPQLWKETVIKLEESRQLPSCQAVQDNASFISRLTVHYRLAVDPQWRLTCPQLQDLTINGLTMVDKNVHKDYGYPLTDLIRRHSRTIRTMAFEIKVDESVLEALLDCPRLESLTFTRDIKIESISRWVQLYQKLRLQLHTLAFSGLGFEEPETEMMTPARIEEWYRSCAGPSRIQDLTLTIDNNDENTWELELLMVENCPDLVRLAWGPQEPDQREYPVQRLVKIFQASRHSKLEKMDLSYITFNDEDFEQLLRSIRRLTSLDLNYTNFRPTSWEKLQAMPHHLETLVAVTVEACFEIYGSTVQAMLCSLPNLKVFRGDGLSEKDLENDPRPWVCRDLEHLSVTFILSSGNLSSYWALDYLSRIGQLRRLKLWNYISPTDRVGIQHRWEVHGGLDQLKALHGLQTIDNDILSYGQEELQWILDHWPNLVQPSRSILEHRLRDLMLMAET